MFRGLSKYVLTADDNNHRGVQLRADGGFGVRGSSRANERFDVNTNTRSSREKVTTDPRFEKNLMEDFVAYQSNDFMRRIARDMFLHDPISGQAVEMMSHLPFSEFEVAAIPDAEKEKHVASMNAMHMHELLPEIAQEEMVEGKHLSMMNFNESRGTFTGIIPFDPAMCDLTYLPVYGRDPLVNVKIAPYWREMVKSKDNRVISELENYGDDIKTMVESNSSFPVPQEYLLYVARRAFSFMPEGISVFRRIAAVWLYEKNLFRGTLDMSSRKQKSLMHAILGDEDFIPTNDQLAQVGEMIVNAERNPVGAMIVTRPGLDIQEIGSNGSDIWKVDEAYDFFTTTKLRGLGLSDQIYGDFSVQSAENTLSSMIEKLVDTRSNITQRVLINRVALTIAVKNDFKKSRKEIEASADKVTDRRFMVTGSATPRVLGSEDSVINPDDYNLPQIRYTKVLRLLSNSALFESLNTMTQSGFPVPLRFLAAALGQSSDEFIAAYPEDLRLRKVIADYQAALPKAPAQAGAGAEDDDSAFSEASDFEPPKKNRDFSHLEVRDPQTGRLMTRKGRRVWDDSKNKLILQAADRVRDYHERKDKASVEVKPKRFHHSR